MLRRYLPALLMASMAMPTAAAVYKCKDASGNLTFSSQPCAKDAEVITVQTHTPSADAVAAANKALDATTEDVEQMRIRREIGQLEEQIKVKERQQITAMNSIRYQQSLATNNLAGATYNQSLATEMQAVTAKYQGEIDSLRRQIDVLRTKQK